MTTHTNQTEALKDCDCWRVNYGLDKSPQELADFWNDYLPVGCAMALKAACEHIRQLSKEIEVLREALQEPVGRSAMTKDQIIAWAMEADAEANKHLQSQDDHHSDGHEALLYFAQLVAAQAAAEEREACARMADEFATWGGSNFCDWFKKLAAAIRARK